jgi:hypothetical protein
VLDIVSSALKQLIFIKMKFSQTLLERHPRSDASCRNSDMVIKERESGRHRLNDALYRDMMIRKRGSACHRLSSALHQHPHVVSNEQEFSHFT